MPATLVRRLRLPPAATSPAAARSAVRTLLREAGLDRLRDEALLLTSELVTNGVIHAGTEIELEISVDAAGLRVVVTDFAQSPARPGSARTGLAYPPPFPVHPGEGGRGLLLVTRFATAWGTMHARDGQAVWFRLDRSGGGRACGRDVAPVAPSHTDLDSTDLAPTDAAPPGWDIDAVLTAVLGPGTQGDLAVASRERLGELVSRLGRGLSAATATVTVDRADGRGPQVIARYDADEPVPSGPVPGGRVVRVPLTLARPWTGEFTATGARGRHAEHVAALTSGQMALLIENQRLADARDSGRGWLLFLAEAGQLLAQSMNVELTVALIPQLVVPRLGRWCAVHLTNEYGELERAALAHADENALPGLSRDLDDRLPLLERVLDAASTTPLGAPAEGMVLPLRVRSERFGTLTIGRPDGRPHAANELAIIEDLARRAAVAIDNARVHANRSRIATTLQRSLLPPELPTIDGLEVAAQYVPAGDGMDVGGDFYDLIPLPRPRDKRGDKVDWMLVVGDVSGKGAGAAAVTGLVRDVLRTLAGDYRAPEHTLRRLNTALVDRGGGYFCTLALAFLEQVSPGVFDLSLHLAGHDRPVLMRGDGTTSLVGTSGTALGLLDSIQTPRTAIRLHSGDSVVFYTDGVTERRRGAALFGQNRLCRQISSLAGSPAGVLAAHLKSAVLEFSAQQPRDDIAIVALRAL